ncbi:DUF4395 domain-containing protein [Mycobacterium parmense]|uniref:Membrane protein n=1 Tax=Mycobacterium parmense TaxID=185642 RepID=A0A7I7Z2F8_9MYCO|nr:DUF4395 domain-containing protein [Mycobacterium parmense]MCV7350138.1 DUF4395 domain-containing protein [Mycobacterium parmense]ORW59854.1 hypothetical protein AWC20_01575 [Mycobacterium parmense]BBZ47333.1 membrane protein [Mycobacterium parmense]
MPASNTTIHQDQVDVRGPRFAAWVTTAVLVVALLTAGINPPAAAALLTVQAAVFAIGAVAGPRRHPYGRLFARFAAPRLGPVGEREPVAPLKFAQLVGLVFAVAGAVGFAAGAFLPGVVATAAALFAAFVNAAFGICLGCRLYPLVSRLRPIPRPGREHGGHPAGSWSSDCSGGAS